MKILITENQLDKLIEKYIDSRLKNLWERESPSFKEGISRSFYTRNHKWIMEYVIKEKLLYLDYEILQEIMNVFSTGEDSTKELFGKWYFKKYNNIVKEIISMNI